MDYTAEIWRIFSLVSWGVWLLAMVYALVVSGFIVLENRSPQLTFAWLLLFFLVPVVGVAMRSTSPNTSRPPPNPRLPSSSAGRSWRSHSTSCDARTARWCDCTISKG